MKRFLWISMAALICLVPASAEIGQIPQGFTPIFNGKDLTGWHISRSSHHGTTPNIRAEQGEIRISQNPIGEGGIILTNKRYKDFELYLEAMPDWQCDSGIFLRSNEDGNAYQITVDYLPKGSIGAFITEGIPALNGTGPRRAEDWQKIWKRDAWNSFWIRMTGDAPHVTIKLNDVQIVDYQDDKNHALGNVRDGMIALQIHYTNAITARAKPHGTHRYRNIAIKELN